MQRILVVDDDRVAVDVVSFLLRRAGWEPLAAFDAATARRLFEQCPDLIILDIHLGDADGRDLLQQFRKERANVPILMLTAVTAEGERVHGLELGADDYLCKPFSHRELVARVRALLRRGTRETPEPVQPARLQVGSIVLDPLTHEVMRGDQRIDVTPTEFRLLQTVMSRPNTLVPLRTLLKEVWGHQDLSAKNVVRVTASRLRAKLDDDPLAPRLLQTVRGEGLMFRGKESQSAVSTSTAADGPLALDVIANLQELLSESGMQPLEDLNQVYTGTAARHISAMREAVARGDAGALAEEAHKLRGASATLGAQRVSRLCGLIEKQCRAADMTHVAGMTAHVESEVSAFEDALAPLLAHTPG